MGRIGASVTAKRLHAQDILIMSSSVCARESDMNIMQIIMALGALPGDRQLSADIFGEVIGNRVELFA